MVRVVCSIVWLGQQSIPTTKYPDYFALSTENGTHLSHLTDSERPSSTRSEDTPPLPVVPQPS